jgi:hypothetical protein
MTNFLGWRPLVTIPGLSLREEPRRHVELTSLSLTNYRSYRSLDLRLDKGLTVLHGGNAQEGRRIFVQHTAAQCVRCHAVPDDIGQGEIPRMP